MAWAALSGSIDNLDRVRATWSAIELTGPGDRGRHSCHFTSPSLSERTVRFEMDRADGESLNAFAARVLRRGVRTHEEVFGDD